MDYGSGYTAAYYLTIIDRDTWRDTGRVEITGGSISRVAEGLKNSAAINAREFTDEETWVRVYLDARQGDSAEHIPLITGITSTPERSYDGVLPTVNIQIYSVLKPLEDILLPRGWYAAAQANGAGVIAELLTATPAPVVIATDAPRLQEAIIAEEGETNLSMLEKVLTAINWRVRIHGDGTIEVTQRATEAAAFFDPVNADLLEPEITTTRDWFAIPNVLRATSGDLSATARDDDPDSPLSTVSRGREVWAEETAAEFNTGETLAEYAARRLKEQQQIAIKGTYARRFMPDVYPEDLVVLNYPEQGLNGVYTINSQNIDLSYAARTQEEVLKNE